MFIFTAFAAKISLAATNNASNSFLFEKALAKEESFETLDLETRIKILKNVSEIAESEIDSLKNKLDKIEAENNWKKIKESAVKNLDQFKNYYVDFKNKLDPKKISSEDVKILAKELKDWREKNYSPELKEIINMILVFETENLLKISKIRLDKISGDIKKMDRQNIIKTDSLKNYFGQAEKRYKNSVKLWEDSKNLFLKSKIESISPKKEDNLEKEAVKKDLDEKEKIQPEIQDSARDLLRESLKEIKAVYDIFFQMNEEMKKYL